MDRLYYSVYGPFAQNNVCSYEIHNSIHSDQVIWQNKSVNSQFRNLVFKSGQRRSICTSPENYPPW